MHQRFTKKETPMNSVNLLPYAAVVISLTGLVYSKLVFSAIKLMRIQHSIIMKITDLPSRRRQIDSDISARFGKQDS
jgi:hypothetical protein